MQPFSPGPFLVFWVTRFLPPQASGSFHSPPASSRPVVCPLCVARALLRLLSSPKLLSHMPRTRPALSRLPGPSWLHTLTPMSGPLSIHLITQDQRPWEEAFLGDTSRCHLPSLGFVSGAHHSLRVKCPVVSAQLCTPADYMHTYIQADGELAILVHGDCMCVYVLLNPLVYEFL